MADVTPARDHAEAESLHRDDLARDVAREWLKFRNSGRVGVAGPELPAALDRLAAAYGEKLDGKGD